MPVEDNTNISEDLKVLDEVEQESDVEISSEVDSDDSTGDPEEESGEEGESEPESDDEPEVKADDEESVFAKVKKLAPDLFKKMPELRAIIGKEKQYSEVFSSPEEAKEASEKIVQFRELSDAVIQGDAGAFFKELVESDANAYKKFAKNILPTVKQADPQMFATMVVPYIKEVLRNSMNTAKANKNQNLYYAVGHLSKHLFNTPTVPDDERSDDVNAEREQFEREKEEHKLTQLQSFEVNTGTELDNRLNGLISKYIDPDKVLTEKQRLAMIKDCKEEITSITTSDSAHMSRLKTIRREAQRDGLTREASERIQNTVLARVKPLLASVSEKVRRDYAFDKRTLQKKDKKFIPSSGTSGNSEGKRIDSKRVDYRNTSDLDILDGKVNYRK